MKTLYYVTQGENYGEIASEQDDKKILLVTGEEVPRKHCIRVPELEEKIELCGGEVEVTERLKGDQPIVKITGWVDLREI
jgi:hypothetical protein